MLGALCLLSYYSSRSSSAFVQAHKSTRPVSANRKVSARLPRAWERIWAGCKRCEQRERFLATASHQQNTLLRGGLPLQKVKQA